MTLRKFSDTDAARRALWMSGRDSELGRRIRRLWARTLRLAPLGIPRGLRRFRTIEEANEERRSWTRRRVEALRVRDRRS